MQTRKSPFTSLSLKLMALMALLVIVAGSWSAFHAYGKLFPSFLSMANGEVGALHPPRWTDGKALAYHDLVLSLDSDGEKARGVFLHQGQTLSLDLSLKPLQGTEFFIVAVLPILCALFYWISGLFIYRYQKNLAHRHSLLAFHLCLSIYFASLFDFHSSHLLSLVFLLSFVAISILLYQLALSFPLALEPEKRYKKLKVGLSVLGCLLALPYLFLFFQKNPTWLVSEKALLIYAAGAYILWLLRIFLLSRKPLAPFLRSFSRYLFWGNLSAFLVPFAVGMTFFIVKRALPFQYVVPLTLLFPAFILLATLLALFKDSQMRLVQAEKMASLGNLMSGIAHEINNPLNFLSANLDTLKSYLHFLKSNLGHPEARYRDRMNAHEILEESEVMASEMENGLNRIEDIIRLLKKMIRGEEMPTETFLVQEAVDEAIGFLALSHPNLKNWVYCEISQGATLRLPRTIFLEVLLNLLSNALYALKDLPQKPQAISIYFYHEATHAVLAVIDQGCGISSQDLPRVKDAFFTTKPVQQGMGMGLALVERWVQAWRGTLEIKSELGKGTEVWIKIPQ